MSAQRALLAVASGQTKTVTVQRALLAVVSGQTKKATVSAERALLAV